MESKVLAIARETADTVTIRLAADFSFTPGQFVMLGLRIGDKEVKRSYSIASSQNNEWIEVTIKKQQHGLFSAAAQQLEQGQAINLYGPFGHHFLFKPEQTERIVLIAGGSGICPFRSFLQAAAASGYKRKLTLLYSVKTTKDIIYSKQFDAWKQQLDLDVVITLTRPGEEELESWTGKLGRITPKLLKDSLGQDLSGMRFYICGPTGMVVDCQSLLASLGVQKQQIQTEKFGLLES